MEIPIWYRYW